MRYETEPDRIGKNAVERPAVRRPGRREFIALGAGAFAVALTPRFLRSGPQLVRRSVPVMGTVADIAVVHRDVRHAHGAIDAAVQALFDVETTMTRFRTDSDIGRANLGAAKDAVAVTDATAHVVREAIRWAEGTDGAFDPAILRLIEAWDVAHRREPPPRDVTARYADRRLYRSVETGITAGRRVLRFHDADVALDLGGIAKGYGVDLAVAALRDWGVTDAIVNVGGDLYAAGASLEGDPWRVGIRSVSHANAITGTLEIRDQAVATSGDYEQGFDHDGRHYHHLLDPVTAEPRLSPAHSLTIVADDCLTADAAATALFGATAEETVRKLASLAPRAALARPA